MARSGGSKRRTRREYLKVESVDPKDGKLFDIYIAQDRLIWIGKQGKGRILESRDVVTQALRKPFAIFEGMKRDADDDRRSEGWLCYCTVPDRAYAADGRKLRPWANQVFLVFVNHDRVAYNWYWTKADPQDTNLPEGYADRFKRRAL